MILRVIRGLVAGLILALIVILGVSYSSAHAQTQTRHLVFSTYLGPKTPPPPAMRIPSPRTAPVMPRGMFM